MAYPPYREPVHPEMPTPEELVRYKAFLREVLQSPDISRLGQRKHSPERIAALERILLVLADHNGEASFTALVDGCQRKRDTVRRNLSTLIQRRFVRAAKCSSVMGERTYALTEKGWARVRELRLEARGGA